MNFLNSLVEKVLAAWAAEPVAIVALITGVLDLAIAFGAPISPEQKTAVIGLFSAIGVIVAREQVIPVAKL